jgi:hypothetical protein
VKTNNPREIPDSALLVISMTYDPRRETFRFAKDSFRFGYFWPHWLKTQWAYNLAFGRNRHCEKRGDELLRFARSGDCGSTEMECASVASWVAAWRFVPQKVAQRSS